MNFIILLGMMLPSSRPLVLLTFSSDTLGSFIACNQASCDIICQNCFSHLIHLLAAVTIVSVIQHSIL